MNIVVLGPGAIGSLWANYLHNAGHSVSLWSRYSSSSISSQLDNNASVAFINNCHHKLESADILLVTLKAPLVEPVIQELQTHISAETIIVLMHNGMGTAEPISSLMPYNPLVVATTTHGALRSGPHHVLHTGRGQTQLGGYNALGERCDFLQDVLNHALPKVTWNPNIMQALWHKLAINCAINPLTAIHRVNNGELAKPRFALQKASVIEEVTTVMLAEGIECDFESLLSSVDGVIQATAENYSSMQQDIFHQRPSEIDFITGHLVAKAEQHGIDVPTNTKLYNQIKQIEQGWKSS